MQAGHGKRETRVLVLSACLPDRAGTSRHGGERRVWELLEALRGRHELTLAATTDGPVHLDQWRALSRLADRVELLPRLGPCLSGLQRAWGRMRSVSGARHPQVGRFAAVDRTYDAVVCAEPVWWPGVRLVRAVVRVCDVRGELATSVAIDASVLIVPPGHVAPVPGQAAVTLERLSDHLAAACGLRTSLRFPVAAVKSSAAPNVRRAAA